MTQPILSILIPTVPDRYPDLLRLLGVISKQTHLPRVVNGNIGADATFERHFNPDGPVEVLIISDEKVMTIGEKRELLYQQSAGLYAWQIDDDDSISETAIERILQSLMAWQPDCVTFQENCQINGQYFSSNHELKYADWGEKQDGFDYVRTPFYKSVIRTGIAKCVPFERIRYGEDHAWARALRPYLSSETHIPEELYFYIHNSKPEDHNDRYGIL